MLPNGQPSNMKSENGAAILYEAQPAYNPSFSGEDVSEDSIQNNTTATENGPTILSATSSAGQNHLVHTQQQQQLPHEQQQQLIGNVTLASDGQEPQTVPKQSPHYPNLLLDSVGSQQQPPPPLISPFVPSSSSSFSPAHQPRPQHQQQQPPQPGQNANLLNNASHNVVPPQFQQNHVPPFRPQQLIQQQQPRQQQPQQQPPPQLYPQPSLTTATNTSPVYNSPLQQQLPPNPHPPHSNPLLPPPLSSNSSSSSGLNHYNPSASLPNNVINSQNIVQQQPPVPAGPPYYNMYPSVPPVQQQPYQNYNKSGMYPQQQQQQQPQQQLIQSIYPDLYPLHNVANTPVKSSGEDEIPDFSLLHLCSDRIDANGVYLLDKPELILVYVCRNVSSQFCQNKNRKSVMSIKYANYCEAICEIWHPVGFVNNSDICYFVVVIFWALLDDHLSDNIKRKLDNMDYYENQLDGLRQLQQIVARIKEENARRMPIICIPLKLIVEKNLKQSDGGNAQYSVQSFLELLQELDLSNTLTLVSSECPHCFSIKIETTSNGLTLSWAHTLDAAIGQFFKIVEGSRDREKYQKCKKCGKSFKRDFQKMISAMPKYFPLYVNSTEGVVIKTPLNCTFEDKFKTKDCKFKHFSYELIGFGSTTGSKGNLHQLGHFVIQHEGAKFLVTIDNGRHKVAPLAGLTELEVKSLDVAVYRRNKKL